MPRKSLCCTSARGRHAFYSGIIGAGIGYFVSRRDVPVIRRILPALAAFVAVVVLEAAEEFGPDDPRVAALAAGIPAIAVANGAAR